MTPHHPRPAHVEFTKGGFGADGEIYFISPSGCNISYPHRAACINITIAWMGNDWATYRCLVRIGFQILINFSFDQKSKCRGWGPTLGANQAVAKTVYFSFVQKSRCRLSFRNQDANYRCVVRLGFQILRKFNFVQKSRCRGWGPTLGDNQAVAKTVNCRTSYAVFFKQN